MQDCLLCNLKFINIYDHLEKYHNPKPTGDYKNVKFYCPLCKVKFNNKQEHFCSELHRCNVRKNEIENNSSLEDFKTHFDKYCNEQTINALGKKYLETEDPFWMAAKEQLDDEDYKKLKEEIIGRRKNIRYSRHSRFKRFSRIS